MKGKLIASAGSKEDLTKLINEFYCSNNYIITEDNKLFNEKLSNVKLDIINNSVKVVFSRKRWRFEFK